VDSDGARSASPSEALTGTVSETLPRAMYRVRLDDGPYVLTHIADRIDRNFVRVLVGDRVRVELSRVDAGRGRIVGKIG
jgi:translation initiation factor IF-1